MIGRAGRGRHPRSLGKQRRYLVPIDSGPVVHSSQPSPDGTSKAELIDLMFDEEYQQARRWRLPESITAGHRVYAVDLAVHPHYLPERHLSDEMPMVPCLAEPGDQGGVRAIPYWCAFDVPPPPWAQWCGVFIA